MEKTAVLLLALQVFLHVMSGQAEITMVES